MLDKSRPSWGRVARGIGKGLSVQVELNQLIGGHQTNNIPSHPFVFESIVNKRNFDHPCTIFLLQFEHFFDLIYLDITLSVPILYVFWLWFITVFFFLLSRFTSFDSRKCHIVNWPYFFLLLAVLIWFLRQWLRPWWLICTYFLPGKTFSSQFLSSLSPAGISLPSLQGLGFLVEYNLLTRFFCSYLRSNFYLSLGDATKDYSGSQVGFE